MPVNSSTLSPDRCFAADPARRRVARELYAGVNNLPLVCPHGHVPPALLADPDATLGTPAELFIIPDRISLSKQFSAQDVRALPLDQRQL